MLAQITAIARSAAAEQSAATVEAMRDMQTEILKGIEALETRQRPPQ